MSRPSKRSHGESNGVVEKAVAAKRSQRPRRTRHDSPAQPARPAPATAEAAETSEAASLAGSLTMNVVSASADLPSPPEDVSLLARSRAAVGLLQEAFDVAGTIRGRLLGHWPPETYPGTPRQPPAPDLQHALCELEAGAIALRDQLLSLLEVIGD